MPRLRRNCFASAKLYAAGIPMKLTERLDQIEPIAITGRVAQAVGIVIENV